MFDFVLTEQVYVLILITSGYQIFVCHTFLFLYHLLTQEQIADLYKGNDLLSKPIMF